MNKTATLRFNVIATVTQRIKYDPKKISDQDIINRLNNGHLLTTLAIGSNLSPRVSDIAGNDYAIIESLEPDYNSENQYLDFEIVGNN